MHVSYTEATLAAMGAESEAQLQLLWWNASGSAWVPSFFATVDRAAEEVVATQALLGEFALVVGEEVPAGPGEVYLPLALK